MSINRKHLYRLAAILLALAVLTGCAPGSLMLATPSRARAAGRHFDAYRPDCHANAVGSV